MKSEETTAKHWLNFAREDLKAVESLINDKIFTLACFHAQQVAEKSLKSFIAFKLQSIPRLHSLFDLYQICLDYDESVSRLDSACKTLDRFYIPVRYPDAMPGMLPEGLPNKADALEAWELAEEVFEFVKQKIY